MRRRQSLRYGLVYELACAQPSLKPSFPAPNAKHHSTFALDEIYSTLPSDMLFARCWYASQAGTRLLAARCNSRWDSLRPPKLQQRASRGVDYFGPDFPRHQIGDRDETPLPNKYATWRHGSSGPAQLATARARSSYLRNAHLTLRVACQEPTPQGLCCQTVVVKLSRCYPADLMDSLAGVAPPSIDTRDMLCDEVYFEMPLGLKRVVTRLHCWAANRRVLDQSRAQTPQHQSVFLSDDRTRPFVFVVPVPVIQFIGHLIH